MAMLRDNIVEHMKMVALICRIDEIELWVGRKSEQRLKLEGGVGVI